MVQQRVVTVLLTSLLTSQVAAQSTSGTQSNETLNLGLIIGCTLGGVVLVILVFCLLLILCRPSKKAPRRNRPSTSPPRNSLQKNLPPLPPAAAAQHSDIVPPGIWASNPSMGGAPQPFHQPPGGLRRVPFANGAPAGASRRPHQNSSVYPPPSSRSADNSAPRRPPSDGQVTSRPLGREQKETVMVVDDAFSENTRRTDGLSRVPVHRQYSGEHGGTSPTAKVFSDYREPADALQQVPLDVRAFSSLTTLDSFQRDNSNLVSYVYQQRQGQPEVKQGQGHVQGMIPRAGVRRTQSKLEKGPTANRPAPAVSQYGRGRFIGDPSVLQQRAAHAQHTVPQDKRAQAQQRVLDRQRRVTSQQPAATAYTQPEAKVTSHAGPSAHARRAGVGRSSSFMFSSTPTVAHFQSLDHPDVVYARPNKLLGRTEQEPGLADHVITAEVPRSPVTPATPPLPPPPAQTSPPPAPPPPLLDDNKSMKSRKSAFDDSKSYATKGKELADDAFRFLEDFDDAVSFGEESNTHM